MYKLFYIGKLLVSLIIFTAIVYTHINLRGLRPSKAEKERRERATTDPSEQWSRFDELTYFVREMICMIVLLLNAILAGLWSILCILT